jgi:hypothetical protein
MGTDQITLANGSASLAVAGATTIYTKALRVKAGEYFAVSYKFPSALGAPDVKIEVEQSFQLPTTEGAADADYWTTPENVNPIESSLTTETIRHKALNIPALPFLRFKITGAVANAADTIGAMWLTRQEE